MMRSLFKEKGAEFRVEIVAAPAVQKFVDTHASVLNSAFQKVEMSEAMRRRLTRSNYIFSGMKAFHELNEAFPSLLDENGNRKPFERFLNDVQSIDRTYNTNYLRAEYNFVAASAEMAGKWEAFMRDGDRYNLQYRTQRDDKVRPEHAALDRVTLPPSDSFWEDFYPPNGWNCFVGSTPVLTATGWKPIQDIRTGDSVIGGSGKYRTVIAVHSREVDAELIRICTKGAFATCTENHRFLTSRGWKSAGELDPFDILVQVGEVSALGKLVNAINNAATLGKYLLVPLKRKWEPVAPLAVNGKIKRGNVEIDNIAPKQSAMLEWESHCRKVMANSGLGFASMSYRDAGMNNNPSDSSLIDIPVGGQPSEAALLNKIPRLGGIDNPAALDGFNSFYDFLRRSFFHTRYSLVEYKGTTKKLRTTVFNLSVEDDESYIVPVGIAHNCRCTVVQVRKSKYPVTPHDEAMRLGDEALQRDSKGIFRFNPGIERKTVPDYNPYTIRRCRDCDVAKGKAQLARFIPDNEVCKACVRLRGLAEQEAKKKLDSTERAEAKSKALEWAEKHLPKVELNNGTVTYRARLKVDSTGDEIIVSKTFINETFSKCLKKRNVADVMELATKVSEWLPKATFIGTEAGRHHKFPFKVYETEYNGIRIQFKAKDTEGNILYIMRILKD